MKIFLEIFGKTLATIFKTCFLLLIVAFMIFVNYTVDCSGVYHSDSYETLAARLLLDGNALNYYDNLNERKLNAAYIAELGQPLDTVVMGSSRAMQIRDNMVQSDSFFNFGVSGGDFEDIVGTFSLLEKANKLPANIIISLDHWVFNPSEAAVNPRSDKELYKEFLDQKLNISQTYHIEEGEEVAPDYWPLLDPAYFQNNISHWIKTKDIPKDIPTTVNGDIHNQKETIKLSDGSVVYSRDFRNFTSEEINNAARNLAASFPGMQDFDKLETPRLKIFEKFIQYVRNSGVNVIFVLMPFHPLVYRYISFYNDTYKTFFEIETWVANFAKENSIPLYGSYNPYILNCFNDDFFDGLHIRPEAISTFFPQLQKILTLQKANTTIQSKTFYDVCISLSSAKKIIYETYPAGDEYILVRDDDIVFNKSECYVFTRYKEKTNTTVIDRFAVSKDSGLLYRYNTSLGNWSFENLF